MTSEPGPGTGARDGSGAGSVRDTPRMSFGDHLEELRACSIRALLGVAIGTAFTLYFGREILEIIYRPLLVVQFTNGLQPRVLALSPTGPFSAYMRIGMMAGLLVTMPWVLYQAWSFVASGLYAHERRFVRLLAPASLALFVIGVLFLYYIVLPIVLQFLIGFNRTFGMPDLTPSALHALLQEAGDAPTVVPPTDTGTPAPLKLPVLSNDPHAPAVGDAWVNARTHRLLVQTAEGTWSAPLDPGPVASAMHSEFALEQYVSFVLLLALAFGLAFETPVVVFFLAWAGIVPVATLKRNRKIVILAIAVVAMVLTPPDVVSQLLLGLPMYLLFELGVIAASTVETRREAG